MAETAPDSSLYSGSEPVFDIVCHPCSSVDKNVEAEGYCEDCCEFLCSTCMAYHQIFSVSKYHNILDKDVMPKEQGTQQVMDVCKDRCEIHKLEIIKYFCPTHTVLGCSVCVTLKHKLCEDVVYIPDVVSGLEESPDYKGFKAKLDRLILMSDETITSAEESKKKSSDCQTRVLKQLEAYRQAIIDAVDERIDELKDQARQITAQDLDKMNRISDEGNRVLTEMKSLSSDFVFLSSKKLYCQLFIEMKNKEQSLTELRGKLEDVRDTEVSDYMFRQDTELLTALGRKDGLGILRDMKQMKAIHIADIDPKSFDNIYSKTHGLTLLSTDKLVAVDEAKCTVKVIDTANYKIISEFKTEREPWDVTVIRDKVATTLPNACKILLLKYDNGLVKDRDVRVNGHCRGIDSYDDNLFVTFGGEKKLEIMTMEGVVLKSFQTDDQGGQLFDCPEYVTVSAANQAIYVSDREKKQVMILDLDGEVEGVYKDNELSVPRQLAVDQAGAMYLCSMYNDTVHLLSPQGTKVKILLKQQDGVVGPESVCYCETTGQLFVGSDWENIIKVYKVA